MDRIAFNTTLLTMLLFLLACKPTISSDSLCSKNPSDRACQSLTDTYVDLRSTTFQNKYDEAVLLEEVDILGERFQELSVEAQGVASCISLPSQSYANYFRALSASLRAHKISNVPNDNYPKGKVSKGQEEPFTRCTWDLGETLIMVTDDLFSRRDEIKDGASLVRLINKLNSGEVSDNLACSLILTGLSQTQMLIDPTNGYSLDREIIEAELRKCNFNVEATDYIGASDKFIEERVFMTARSNFSLLDQEVTGWDEILRFVP